MDGWEKKARLPCFKSIYCRKLIDNEFEKLNVEIDFVEPAI
jgi:hypothetical protein